MRRLSRPRSRALTGSARRRRRVRARCASGCAAIYGMPVMAPHGDPLGELVLTVLSQSTNDRNRDVAFLRLRERFPAWEAVRDAPVEEVEEAIRRAVSKVKSRRIKEMLEALPEDLDLSWMRDAPVERGRAATCARCPASGRKTAACVLLFAYALRDVPVDTHVSRVGTRLHLLRPGAPFDELHDEMLALTPPGAELELHVNLLRHGRRTCHAQRPRAAPARCGAMCPRAAGVTQIALATCSGVRPSSTRTSARWCRRSRALGVDARPVDLGRPVGATGVPFDLVVVRSTWDYVGRRDELLALGAPRGPRRQPAGGARVVDRQALPRRTCAPPACRSCRRCSSSPASASRCSRPRSSSSPRSPAGSRDTGATTPETENATPRRLADAHPPQRAHGAWCSRTSPASRATARRRCCICGGAYSHAIHKGAAARCATDACAHGLFVEEQISAARADRAPSARSAIASSRTRPSASARCAYARVDLLPALGGHLVLELELAEPSLFLTTSPGAPERFAARARRARGRRD